MQLTEVGRVVHKQHRTLYVEFAGVTSQEKTSVTLQEGETSAYRWVSRQQLLQMTEKELTTERIWQFMEEFKG